MALCRRPSLFSLSPIAIEVAVCHRDKTAVVDVKCSDSRHACVPGVVFGVICYIGVDVGEVNVVDYNGTSLVPRGGIGLEPHESLEITVGSVTVIVYVSRENGSSLCASINCGKGCFFENDACAGFVCSGGKFVDIAVDVFKSLLAEFFYAESVFRG